VIHSNGIIISDSDEEQEVMAMDSQHCCEEDSRKDVMCFAMFSSGTRRHDLDDERDRESYTASNYSITVPMRTIQQKVLILLIVLCALVTVANKSHFHVRVWDAPILVSHINH